MFKLSPFLMIGSW